MTDGVQTALIVSWVVGLLGGLGSGIAAMEYLDTLNVTRKVRGQPVVQYPGLYAVSVGIVVALLGPMTCAAMVVTALVYAVRFVRVVTAKPPADSSPVTNGSYRGEP